MLRTRTVFEGPSGTPWLSTMYWFGDTQAEADAAIADLGVFWSAVDAGMSSTVTWRTEAEVFVINVGTGAVEEVLSTTPATGSGASAGDLLPRQSQMLVRWFTTTVVAGRRLRGRTFVPGITEAFNGAGVPTSAFITTVQTAANALLASATSSLLVWSRAHGVAAGAASANVWSQWANLRSRRD